MRKVFFLLCSCLFSWAAFSQASQTTIAIIPEPVTLVKNAGQFSLPENVVIEAGTQPEIKPLLAFLKARLATPTGRNVTVSNAAPTATIRLLLNKTADNTLGKEGYQLSVTPTAIIIKANQPAGLFYGAQTLMQ